MSQLESVEPVNHTQVRTWELGSQQNICKLQNNRCTYTNHDKEASEACHVPVVLWDSPFSSEYTVHFIKWELEIDEYDNQFINCDKLNLFLGKHTMEKVIIRGTGYKWDLWEHCKIAISCLHHLPCVSLQRWKTEFPWSARCRRNSGDIRAFQILILVTIYHIK